MQHFSLTQIQNWERFYRANFINSLSGFKSVSLIASINAQQQTNLAIFSNIVHLGADPALIGFINRPKEAAPHTIHNIEINQHYTINHIQASYFTAAHQTSAKYPSNISEFAAVGLTEEWIEGIPVPFVKESAIKYALTLSEIIPIKQNNTFLVIGNVTDVLIEEAFIEQDGFIDAAKAGSITSLGIDGYYSTQKIERLSYAKPDSLPQPI